MAKGNIAKGIITGVIGGAIALGGNYAYQNAVGGTGSASNTAGTTSVTTTAVKNTTSASQAISKVSGAVVSVLNYQTQSQSDSSDNPWADLFGGGSNSNSNSNASSTPTLTSEGSGVIYKKQDGTAFIVTNYHVVASASELKVQLSDGRTIEAKLVGTEPTKDLAVLKINSQYVTEVATFANSSKLTIGESAIAIGSPQGTQFANSATEGIVSAVNRSVSYQQDSSNVTTNINAIQTDAAINPGNSGGALVNIEGQVIGINSSKLAVSTDGSTPLQGMGFAIPSNDVVNVINKIENGKKIPAVGIQMTDLSTLSSAQMKENHISVPASVTGGVVIGSVTHGLPAANAGLKAGDVIVKFGSRDITSGSVLQSALLNYSVGDSVKVVVYRDGTQKTVTLKLTADQSQIQGSNNNSNSNSGN